MLSCLLLALSLGPTAHGQTVFEGFYRIERAKKHVGFGVQRLRKDGDKRILTSYYRLKQPDGSEVFDSYKTISNARGEPISSEHQGNRGFGPATFASFRGGVGQVRFGSWQRPVEKMTRKVDLLSSQLFFTADLPGLEVGKVYQYRAFAEEFGRHATGTLHVIGAADTNGLKVYRVVDDFTGEPAESFVTATGQTIGTRSLTGETYAFWVGTREEAIGEFPYPNRDVSTTFGDLPVGSKNEFAGLESFNAESVMRASSNWRGKRIRSPAALVKTMSLPKRVKF